MRKTHLGGQVITLLILINLLLWATFTPANDGRENFNSQVIAEMFSTSALILMSCGIGLSLRPRKLEPYFGGLDKMYGMHKSVQLLAIIFLGCHFSTVAMTSTGFNWGPSLGKIALIGLVTEVFLALTPRLPLFGRNTRLKYHHWKFLHHFTGVFFLIGILHTYRVEPVMIGSTPIEMYVRIISFTGAGLYIYKEVFERLFKKGQPYLVSKIRKLNGTVVEIGMQPGAERMQHRAGQFLFVRFPGASRLGEEHPFTISSAPHEAELRLTIKTSGDFTQRLYETLQAGDQARVQGGYGMFDYTTGSRQQVWIAGGIGITPFLSWVRDFSDLSGREIDFFYSVRSADEAVFLEEIQAAQDKYPTFRFHLHVTNLDGRLSAEKLLAQSGPGAGKDFYLCGPPPMLEALTEQLLRTGITRQAIHFEEFNFR